MTRSKSRWRALNKRSESDRHQADAAHAQVKNPPQPIKRRLAARLARKRSLGI